MAQIIQLKPIIPRAGVEQAHLKKLLSIHVEENYFQTPLDQFINELTRNSKAVNCFDYFLIHYQGEAKQISKLLNEYMGFYSRPENEKKRRYTTRHLSYMLTRPELAAPVKEAIFRAFVRHPALFDEQSSYHLFLYDATKIIRHFGQQGGKKNYERVVDLCTLALQKLDPEQNQDIIAIAEKARAEAQLELSFNKENGFFSSLFNHIKRCWLYGWTGFFTPNLPTYVAPESFSPEQQNRTHGKITVTKQKPIQRSEKDLPALLKEIQLPISQIQFEEIIEALNLYSLQANPQDELETRQKLHNLLHEILIENQENRKLYQWLKDNQNPFVVNQFRLLELVLQNKPRSEVTPLIQQISKDSDHLQHITEELNCLMPEQETEEETKPKKSEEPVDLLVSAAKKLSAYAADLSELAQTTYTWAEHWTSGFFPQEGRPPVEELSEIEYVNPPPGMGVAQQDPLSS